MQPPFHRGDGERQKTGDVGDGPLLDVVQPQNGLVVRRQRGDRGEDLGVFLASQDLGGGVPGSSRTQFAAVGEEQAVQFGWLRGLLAPAPLADASGPVAGNGA